MYELQVNIYVCIYCIVQSLSILTLQRHVLQQAWFRETRRDLVVVRRKAHAGTRFHHPSACDRMASCSMQTSARATRHLRVQRRSVESHPFVRAFHALELSRGRRSLMRGCHQAPSCRAPQLQRQHCHVRS